MLVGVYEASGHDDRSRRRRCWFSTARSKYILAPLVFPSGPAIDVRFNGMHADYINRPVIGIAIHIFLAAAGLAAALPVRAGCDLVSSGAGKVRRIVDGRTLQLDSGLIVRLAGIVSPGREDFTPTGLGLAGAAEDRLRALAGERTVRLFRGKDVQERDRHARMVAHVFAGQGPERIWLQGRLVEEGLALVAPSSGGGDCLTGLLDREALAENAGTGLWGMTPGPVLGADDLAALYGSRDRFRIVEGRVATAAEVGRRVYVNFGEDWRRDFTVIVAPRHRRQFLAVHGPVAGLEGRNVRTRGWIVLRNGPAISVRHPESVEVAGRTDGSSRAEAKPIRE